MSLYLGILLFSFIITSLVIVPFIDILYRLQLTYQTPLPPSSELESKDFSQIINQQKWKIGTPIGGGILIIMTVSVLFAILFPILIRFGVYVTSVFPLKEELNILFFTFIAFGLLGLFEDIQKIFRLSREDFKRFIAMYKTPLLVVLSLLTSMMLYTNLRMSIINIPYFGILRLGWMYVPLAGTVIFTFARSFDITDGLDGLSGGVLLVCLIAFWALSLSSLDTSLSVFIALWIGALIAFLYFNVYPARIWLGNAGSLSFGATLAVTALILGKTFALFFIGGVFLLDGLSNLVQFLSVRFFSRRILSVTPLHYWLQSRGWPEPKVVMRAWIVSIMLALIGLWLSPP